MKTISYDTLPTIYVNWYIYKGSTAVIEDFSRSQLWVWLIGSSNKWPLSVDINDEGYIEATLPDNLPTGVYSIYAIWTKERDSKITWHSITASDKRCRSDVKNILCVSSDSDAEEWESDELTITLKSQVATYGYDGLSAYEAAYMNGLTTLDEETWLIACNDAVTSGVQLADSYDDTATYAVGDYVSYDGDVYVCSTAVATAGDFDSDYWTICTPVMEYVDGLIESVEEQTVGSLSVTAGSSSVVLDILDTEGNTLASGTIDYPTEDTAGVIRTEAVATTDLSGYTDDALGNYVGALIAKIATTSDYGVTKALSYYSEDTDAGTATLSATSGVTIEATDSGAELTLTGYSTTITAGADNLTLDAGSNYVAMVATNGAKVNGYAVATTLPVTITDDGGSYESDTTYTDIITAIDAGVDVVVNSTDSQSGDNLFYRFTGMSGTSYVFTTFDLTNATVRGLVMSSTGSWTDFSYTLS